MATTVKRTFAEDNGVRPAHGAAQLIPPIVILIAFISTFVFRPFTLAVQLLARGRRRSPC